MKKFAVIIPTYNEKENLKILIPELFSLYPDIAVIIVDDNSTDGTFEFINLLRKKYNNLHIILKNKKEGRGAAVNTGFKEALKIKDIDYFLEMDADCSHQPKDLKRLMDISSPNSIIIGSRYSGGGKYINPIPRILLSRLANFYVRTLLGVPISDLTNGLRLYPRKAVQIIVNEIITLPGHAYLSETAYLLKKKGVKFKEVPIIFINRNKGKSKISFIDYIKSIIGIARIRLK